MDLWLTHIQFSLSQTNPQKFRCKISLLQYSCFEWLTDDNQLAFFAPFTFLQIIKCTYTHAFLEWIEIIQISSTINSKGVSSYYELNNPWRRKKIIHHETATNGILFFSESQNSLLPFASTSSVVKNTWNRVMRIVRWYFWTVNESINILIMISN